MNQTILRGLKTSILYTKRASTLEKILMHVVKISANFLGRLSPAAQEKGSSAATVSGLSV